MIKTTHATLVSVVSMLLLTWWFDGIIDDVLLRELTKIDEILDIKQLHV